MAAPREIQHAELSLLGGWMLHVAPALEHDIGAGGRRVLALLALRRSATRSQVAGTLWPEVVERTAVARLRTVLWRLSGARCLIETRSGALRLDESVGIDVDRMRRAALDLDKGGDHPLPTDAAIEMFDSDLLPGWCEDWLVIDRERMRQLRIGALEALSGRACAAGRSALAVDCGLVAVRADPLRESAHAAVINAYLAAGNNAAAVRQFEACREVFRAELGIEPSGAVGALIPTLVRS